MNIVHRNRQSSVKCLMAAANQTIDTAGNVAAFGIAGALDGLRITRITLVLLAMRSCDIVSYLAWSWKRPIDK